MRLKLLVVALYCLIAFIAASPSFRSFAFSSDESAQAEQAQNVTLPFDVKGTWGLVRFDHRKHEAYINAAQEFHKAPANNSCVGCHHRRDLNDPSINVTDLRQYQKCTNCHREEGNPANPEDAGARHPEDRGIDLNSREAFHRLCISCHRAEKARVAQAGLNRFVPVTCRECHKGMKGEETARLVDSTQLPPPDEGETPAKNDLLPVDSGPVFPTAKDSPIGYAGASRISTPDQMTADAAVVNDRWRIGFPADPRYIEGDIKNPYRQNVLKGDYPVFGQHNFFVLTAESESFFNAKRIPLPSNIAAQRPDSEEFFGRGGQIFFRQNFILSFELFNGDTAFKPVDWRVHVTPVFNINYLNTQENGIVNADPTRGANRTDGYIALQEAFGEYRLGDTTKIFPFLPGGRKGDNKSPFFDTTSVRTGIQPFISDFRGFIFSDVNLGARLFGNYANNRYQFNAAYFYMLEKDTNSELNTPHFRDQTVFIANLFRQDTKFKGYTSQFSFHYNNDRPSRHFDENDFLVRPALIGDVAPHGVKAAYLGWTGDGHMGKWNITHAFYQALGHDSRNPIAGRKTDINAQMAAAELSLDRDWLRFKGSFFFASGDSKPFDGSARGFDSILDFQEFAGGAFSFWNSQGIPFTNTAVLLTTPGSLLPDLRSSKTEGQANFVNPGIFVYNLGSEAELTPKLRAILNLNYLHFHHTEPLSELIFQPDVRRPIGLDYGVGFLYRPILSENAIIAAGFSSLVPGTGFRDIFSSNCAGQFCGAKSKTLYSAFVKLRFTY